MEEVMEFTNSDKDYLDWLRTHPRGFVINMYRNMNPRSYSALHRATCQTISDYMGEGKPGGFTERQYVKVCSDSVTALRQWIRAHGEPSGKFLKQCALCSPG